MIEHIQILLWMIIIPFDKDDEYGIRIHFYDLFLADLLLSGCKQFAVQSSEAVRVACPAAREISSFISLTRLSAFFFPVKYFSHI